MIPDSGKNWFKERYSKIMPGKTVTADSTKNYSRQSMTTDCDSSTLEGLTDNWMGLTDNWDYNEHTLDLEKYRKSRTNVDDLIKGVGDDPGKDEWWEEREEFLDTVATELRRETRRILKDVIGTGVESVTINGVIFELVSGVILVDGDSFTGRFDESQFEKFVNDLGKIKTSPVDTMEVGGSPGGGVPDGAQPITWPDTITTTPGDTTINVEGDVSTDLKDEVVGYVAGAHTRPDELDGYEVVRI